MTTQIAIVLAVLLFARAGYVRVTRPVSDFYVAGRLMPAMLNGMAIAVSAAAALAFVGLAGGIGLYWEGSGAVLVAGLGGLILAGLALAPYLRRYGGYTLPDFLAERFGGDKIRPLGVFAVLLCSFPALAAALVGLGLIGKLAFAAPSWAGVAAGAVMMLVATLIGGMRSLSLSQLAHYAVLFAVSLAALAIVLWQGGTAAAGADGALLGDALPRLKLETFAAGDTLNRLALIFCLAAGIASLPFILMRSFTTPSAEEARTSFFAALIFVALPCLAAPSFAALSSAAEAGNAGAFGAIAEALLTLGAIAVLLGAGAGLALSLANALSYDVYYKSLQPAASTEQRLLVARGAVVLVVVLAAVAAVALPQITLDTAAMAFSLAASAFLPALVLGVWWKRVSGEAALAGMIAGLVVCLYYMLAPHSIPIAFYETSSLLSNATDEQAAAYVALRHSYYLADEGAREAVLADWKAVARTIANWWGISGTYAAVFAVPVGFAVTIAASLFTRAPSKDVQSFVKELREPAV